MLSQQLHLWPDLVLLGHFHPRQQISTTVYSARGVEEGERSSNAVGKKEGSKGRSSVIFLRNPEKAAFLPILFSAFWLKQRKRRAGEELLGPQNQGAQTEEIYCQQTERPSVSHQFNLGDDFIQHWNLSGKEPAY